MAVCLWYFSNGNNIQTVLFRTQCIIALYNLLTSTFWLAKHHKIYKNKKAQPKTTRAANTTKWTTLSMTAATKRNKNQKERACCSDKAWKKKRAKQITTREAKRTITREQNKQRPERESLLLGKIYNNKRAKKQGLLLGKESSGREQLHAGARPLQSSHWLVGGGTNIIILKFNNSKKKMYIIIMQQKQLAMSKDISN